MIISNNKLHYKTLATN